MCGIAFIYSGSQSDEAIRARTRQGLKAMVHRGPDADGISNGPGFVVGHKRLSIIDLSGSRQPMQSPDGRYTLSFNGEIYNYRDLRNELKRNWTFHTDGDTEVLLAGLITQGDDFIQRMEGMWAFALWDAVKQRVFLAEMPALKAIAASPWQEDLDSTADYLRYGFYLPGYTAYREVREVLPGHTLVWSPNEPPRQQAYWTLGLSPFSGTREDAAEQVLSTMRQSINLRLVADVEIGAFLSGGVDSSLVVALLSEVHTRRTKTFTIGFSDPSFDERDYARQIATQYRTDHHEECLTEFSRADLEKLILEHVGQPFADSSILPTAMVSRLAARHVKVALSGDGGDELFSGYQRYQARAILRWYTRLPARVRRSVHHCIRALPEPVSHHSRSLLKKAHLFAGVAERLEAETPFVSALLFSPAELSRLAPDLAERGHRPPNLPDRAELDDIGQMMAADALIYLPQDILTKVDRASMAYGLETRAPFLDRRVVELAFSLPRHWHRSGFTGKRMLRSAFGTLLPSAIWDRRKQGFGVPIGAWCRDSVARELQSLIDEAPGPLHAPAVRDLIDRHIRGARDLGQRLWAIYVYLLWRKSTLPR
jgi:asparagine synthase (glutamine-hydrolysing)